MIISFGIQKGGVGKTTASCMISQYLAFNKNYKVLLIDMDPQANATMTFLEQKDRCIFDVIVRNIPLNEIVKKTQINTLDIVPSNIEMEDLETYLVTKSDGPKRLRHLVDDYSLSNAYDFIIIDTPPHLGRLTMASLVTSDYVAVPLESESYSADGLNEFLKTVSIVQSEFNPKLKVIGAFLNKYETRTILSRDITAQYEKQLGNMLFNTRIRQNVRIRECIAERATLFTFDGRSAGAEDFAALGDELLSRITLNGDLIPVPSY